MDYQHQKILEKNIKSHPKYTVSTITPVVYFQSS